MWGVSFWVTAINVCIYSIVIERVRKLKVVALIVLFILTVIPLTALRHAASHSSDDVQTINAIVIQGNIPPYEKWVRGEEYSWTVYDSLTRKAVDEAGTGLVIWPETAIPSHLMHQSVYAAKLSELSRSLNVSILTGASDYRRIKGKYKPLNAGFLVEPGDGITQRCAKRVLVPFGERVPFQALFPQLGELNFGQAEFLPGSRPVLFATEINKDTIRFPAMICFESAFPAYCADFCRKGAEFLVVITNDMWFGPSSVPYQHAQMSVFRAVENRVPLARCANTGVSMFIDRWGRVKGQTNMFEEKLVYGSIKPEVSKSFYNHCGNFLPVGSLLGTVFIIFAVAFLKRGKYND